MKGVSNCYCQLLHKQATVTSLYIGICKYKPLTFKYYLITLLGCGGSVDKLLMYVYDLNFPWVGWYVI